MQVKSLLAATLFTAGSVAHAGLITTIEAENVWTSQQANVTTIDFENGNDGGVTGDFRIYGPSVTTDSPSASPYGVSDHYLSVPNPDRSGSASIDLGGDYSYFGLFWGSMDTYNTIEFYSNGVLVDSVTGGDVIGLLADGNQQSWRSNRYVNFVFDGGETFDSYTLVSSNYAFETDNHAYGNVSVSEPATLALFGLGLAALGATRRRTK